MLPNILDVASGFNIEIDHKSVGKRETLAKCPFCKEDDAKGQTYYLSLNTKDQVYKCWFCGESGGVLRFEAKLSGISFDKVREKYFGKQKKDLHPAFRLTPEQLEEIDWLSLKQKDFKAFQKSRDRVWKDWNCYVDREMARHFALIMCIAHLENQREKQKEALEWFEKKCKQKPIPKVYYYVIQEYSKPEWERKQWAKKGTEMARIAWKISVRTLDIQMDDIYLNVLFVDYYLKKIDKK